MDQLPLEVVWAVAPVDDDVFDDDEVLDDELDVEGVAVVVVAAVVLVLLVVPAADSEAVVVVDDCPSRQANTPPSESVAATLNAAAALRARAARGLRRGEGRAGSSMTRRYGRCMSDVAERGKSARRMGVAQAPRLFDHRRA